MHIRIEEEDCTCNRLPTAQGSLTQPTNWPFLNVEFFSQQRSGDCLAKPVETA